LHQSILRGTEIFEGQRQIIGALAQFVKQSHILDRNDGLVGKSRNQFDLFGRERLDAASRENNHADRLILAQQRYAERGTLAGNWCTHNAPRTDVAGVDCSAFVSATWGLSTHFTTAAIPAIATPLQNAWDLRPGDALNKPHSHVMLFLRFTPDRKVEVMEASTGGCNGRVCRNVYPLASLLARGYQPVRFKALANDNSLVAQAAMPEPHKGKKARR